jgi:Rad3-related DNA helicase/serine/threonine protein kinase
MSHRRLIHFLFVVNEDLRFAAEELSEAGKQYKFLCGRLVAARGTTTFSCLSFPWCKKLYSKSYLSLPPPISLCYTFPANICSDWERAFSMASIELQEVGPYIISQLLGENTTSRLYLARHQQRKKDTFIKVFLTPLGSNEAKEIFLARAKQLKKLKHRFIIEVQDFGFLPNVDVQQDYAYLVTQYAAGGSMATRIIAGQRIAGDEVKRILSPIADALHYAHVNNIVHGNLHPGNLLVGERNETLLTDFSFPSFDGGTAALSYKAPEQLQGTCTPASDQYALAVIAYEWLCGRRPYEANEKEALLRQQQQEPLPAPRSLNSDISPAVERVLLQALAHNPDERFPHTQAFADAYLRALMGLPMKVETRQAKPPLPKSIGVVVPHGADDSENKTDTSGKGIMLHPAARNADESAAEGDSRATQSPRLRPTRVPSLPRTPAPTDTFHISNRDGIKADAVISKEDHTPIPIAAKRMGDDRKGKLSSDWLDADDSRLGQKVTADLCEGGVLSRRLPGYEERPAQVEMARLVAHALVEEAPAVIEAATGTGKSLAYLLPIVRSSRVAIISTANKALQEQLFYKDIPFVQEHIKYVDAALVKGMGNYVCLSRLEEERIGMQFYAKNRDFTRLLNITKDDESDFNGDFETLGFPLPGDIRGRVNADSDQCAWGKCEFYSECYVRKMRVKAEHAKLIVVNHTLLLLDALMEGHLLPERDVVIVDEAHHLEEEATRCFTITVSPLQVSTLLAQRMLKEHTPPHLQDEANQVMMRAWERLGQVADPGFKGRANLQAPLEEGLLLSSTIAKLADALFEQRPKDMPEKETQLYDKLLARAQNLAENIRTVFSVTDTGKFVYYVERMNTPGRRGGQLEASAAPLDVTAFLKEQLFSKCNVICTSATLATVSPNPARPEDKGANFAYFRRRVGLDHVDYPNTVERILPLTFDYESHALLYLPRDLPEPVFGAGAGNYTKAIAREMLRLVKASRGRAFLLFSSKRMLDEVYEQISPHLDFLLLRQGDLPRIELTRRFREEEGAVLFGLKSFWEGVDIVGEALSLVVIDKLPFDPPDDPVHEARVAQMKAAGENWFGTYVLPQTVLRLKQGLGRLLRTRDDRGVMAILDTRLYTKSYGRTILAALPPARRTASLKDVELFFNEEEAPF